MKFPYQESFDNLSNRKKGIVISMYKSTFKKSKPTMYKHLSTPLLDEAIFFDTILGVNKLPTEFRHMVGFNVEFVDNYLLTPIQKKVSQKIKIPKPEDSKTPKQIRLESVQKQRTERKKRQSELTKQRLATVKQS